MEILIIVAGILVDRLTKFWAVTKLKKVQEIVVIKNFFDLNYVQNRGAAWGIFGGKTVILSIITALILIGIIGYVIKYRPKNMFLRAALSLIIAGAIGNLFDRIYYKYVVDLFSVHYKDIYYYPVFNVADICVVIGTIILAVYIIRDDKKHGKV
ncbi:MULTISPECIES: signal peptidase II [Clostridium]|uniref:signal peptidase II n=1 Tax=Clostridium TaxID=1485 RepID=UPI000826D1AF|nr:MULTISPECIES: signal peptidase II [Clostridium]PJI09908.1 signal peptidase II [Clostridium sp. CT7]